MNTWRQREKDRPHRDTQALENDLVRAQRRREQAEAKRKPRKPKRPQKCLAIELHVGATEFQMAGIFRQ